MQQAGCNTEKIETLIIQLKNKKDIDTALKNCKAPQPVFDFVHNTFNTITNEEIHVQAAVFTFGREDLIPGMFISFVKELNKQNTDRISIFQYYLERHIEVDGDHHSHLAYDMTAQLCGQNDQYWEASVAAVKKSLIARINLWDQISALL